MTQRPTITIRSTDFSSDAKKIRCVGRYFWLYSDIIATEFEIVYGEQGGDLKGAFLVAPGDVHEWVDGLGVPPATMENVDLNWADELLGNAERWRRESTPYVVIRPDSGALIAAYRREGIVLKRFLDPRRARAAESKI